MTWLVLLLLVIAVAAFAYKIYCQLTIELIEKKKRSAQFWLLLSVKCFLPVPGNCRNTSAMILATKANAALCIAYACIAILLLSDVV